MAQPKVIVIGLDGSSWELVNQLRAEQQLPALEKMINQGMSSTMYSTHPAHSAPAWTSFVTGVPPTEHGCLDFLVVHNDITDLDIIDSTKIKQETIYEAMVRHGRRPILINLPNTFPPKLKDAITITSLMTRGEKFIFPASLKQRYPELQHYRLSPNAKLRSKDQFDAYVQDLCQLERDRIAAAKQLLLHEPWDFFFYLCSGTDWVSHVVYDQAVQHHYQPALEMWRLMDEFIGWVMQQLDDDTIIYVISDHGFKVYDSIFYVNRWLEEHGYLATTAGTSSFQQTHTKLSREVAKVQQRQFQFNVGKRLRNVLRHSPRLEQGAKWSYHHIIKRFVPVNVKINLQLDLTKTQVGFPRGSMASLLYVNDQVRFRHGIVPANQRASLTQQLQQQLQAITDPGGQPAIAQVYTTEQLYGNRAMAIAPDLFLQPNQHYLSGSLHSAALFENTSKNYHDDQGMFLAYGKAIAHQPMSDSSIMQMAPTIMHSLGLPLLPQFSATVMDIFASTSSLHQPAQYEGSSEQADLRTIINTIEL
ncbi:MAG: alkaline phosphatase family protein [Candidatus Kerfeldbacteria bacterium]|nr:alkaline phosphatase family protein [Candidatus Kerfeldbacteria bacterium]